MSEEIKEEIKIEEKSGRAKTVSLVGQIIACIWIGSWCSAQFINDIKNGNHIEITDILFSGFAIAGCFIPVYFNMIMDKIKKIKFGGE